MRHHIRFSVGVALFVPILLWWGVGTAAADSSESCRGLADHFAKAPAELDARYLAALMLCVSTEIGERLQITQVMPPITQAMPPTSPQAEAAPGPAPEQPAAPPRRTYGDWPKLSPWTGDWPTSSWDQ